MGGQLAGAWVDKHRALPLEACTHPLCVRRTKPQLAIKQSGCYGLPLLTTTS
jgi:hypothetical protein